MEFLWHFPSIMWFFWVGLADSWLLSK
jgi:hypothetical protein